MKVNYVHISNQQEPGDAWWDHVQENANEPLIEATMKMTLTWNEYQRLLRQARENERTPTDADLSAAEGVLTGIIDAGMIKLVHPSVEEACVFSWDANALEQLDAIIHEAYNIPVKDPV